MKQQCTIDESSEQLLAQWLRSWNNSHLNTVCCVPWMGWGNCEIVGSMVKITNRKPRPRFKEQWQRWEVIVQNVAIYVSGKNSNHSNQHVLFVVEAYLLETCQEFCCVVMSRVWSCCVAFCCVVFCCSCLCCVVSLCVVWRCRLRYWVVVYCVSLGCAVLWSTPPSWPLSRKRV